MLCSSQVGDWKTTVDDDLSAPKLQKPVHWEATEMGGACSCAGIGVILALVSVIIIQFNSSMNAVNKAYMQPARVATISEYSELPVYALEELAEVDVWGVVRFTIRWHVARGGQGR